MDEADFQQRYPAGGEELEENQISQILGLSWRQSRKHQAHAIASILGHMSPEEKRFAYDSNLSADQIVRLEDNARF